MAQRTKVEPNTTDNSNKNKKKSIEQFLRIFCYTHKSESSRGLIRETSSDRLWEQMQRHTATFFQSLWNPEEGWREGRICRSRGFEDTKITQPTESTQQSSQGLTDTETAITEPAWLCIKSSAYVLWLLSWGILWDSKHQECFFLPAFWTLSSYWVASSNCDMRVFLVLLHLVMPYTLLLI